MSADDLINRLIASMANISLSKLTLSKLSEDEDVRYLSAVNELSQLHLFIDDMPGLSVTDIDHQLGRYSRQFGQPAMIAADYVQIIRGGRSKTYSGDNRFTEVEDSAYGLAGLAKTYDCHLVSGAQVKQDVDIRGDKHPMANDLANSDGIVRAASHVLTLFRPAVYDGGASQTTFDVSLVANRHGVTSKLTDFQWNPINGAVLPKEATGLNLF